LISLVHISPLEEAPTIGETMAGRERLDRVEEDGILTAIKWLFRVQSG
jgi:hypothetical protein